MGLYVEMRINEICCVKGCSSLILYFILIKLNQLKKNVKNNFFFRRVFILFLPKKSDLLNTIEVTNYRKLIH